MQEPKQGQAPRETLDEQQLRLADGRLLYSYRFTPPVPATGTAGEPTSKG